MSRCRIATSLTLLTVAAAAFFFADRIIDGPFPQLSKGVRFFEEREAALNAYVRRLDQDGQVGTVICHADEVWIDEPEDGSRIESSGQRLADYLTLCHAAGAALTWRIDGGYLLYVGADGRAGRNFNIALIWREGQAAGPPECSSVIDLRDFGKCVVRLDDDWVLDYEWVPSDYESPREKEVMELAEDFAREALTNPPSEP